MMSDKSDNSKIKTLLFILCQTPYKLIPVITKKEMECLMTMRPLMDPDVLSCQMTPRTHLPSKKKSVNSTCKVIRNGKTKTFLDLNEYHNAVYRYPCTRPYPNFPSRHLAQDKEEDFRCQHFQRHLITT